MGSEEVPKTSVLEWGEVEIKMSKVKSTYNPFYRLPDVAVAEKDIVSHLKYSQPRLLYI